MKTKAQIEKQLFNIKHEIDSLQVKAIMMEKAGKDCTSLVKKIGQLNDKKFKLSGDIAFGRYA